MRTVGREKERERRGWEVRLRTLIAVARLDKRENKRTREVKGKESLQKNRKKKKPNGLYISWGVVFIVLFLPLT